MSRATSHLPPWLQMRDLDHSAAYNWCGNLFTFRHIPALVTWDSIDEYNTRVQHTICRWYGLGLPIASLQGSKGTHHQCNPLIISISRARGRIRCTRIVSKELMAGVHNRFAKRKRATTLLFDCSELCRCQTSHPLIMSKTIQACNKVGYYATAGIDQSKPCILTAMHARLQKVGRSPVDIEQWTFEHNLICVVSKSCTVPQPCNPVIWGASVRAWLFMC